RLPEAPATLEAPPALGPAETVPPRARAVRPRLPSEAPATWAAAPRGEDGNAAPAGSDGPLMWLLEEQLRLMNQQLRVTSDQLALLRQARPLEATEPAEALAEPLEEAPWAAVALPPPRSEDVLGAAAEVVEVRPTAAAAKPALEVAEALPARAAAAAKPAADAVTSPVTSRAKDGRLMPAPFVPYSPPQLKTAELTETQSRYLTRLIARLDRKAGESKRLTQRHRQVLADNRTAVGFRLLFK